MTEQELQAEVQALADRLEPHGTPIGISLLLAAAWDLMQREFPGDPKTAKIQYRKQLRKHLDTVLALKA